MTTPASLNPTRQCIKDCPGNRWVAQITEDTMRFGRPVFDLVVIDDGRVDWKRQRIERIHRDEVSAIESVEPPSHAGWMA